MNGVSLKAYFERLLKERDARYRERFESQDRATSAALVATKEALSVALAATEKSGAAALEANRVLALKAEEFADQKLQAHNNIKPWVQSLIDGLAARVEANERRIARFENREEGMTLTTKLLVGGLGLFATLIGIYFAFHR
jgi:hypothetical protein